MTWKRYVHAKFTWKWRKFTCFVSSVWNHLLWLIHFQFQDLLQCLQGWKTYRLNNKNLKSLQLKGIRIIVEIVILHLEGRRITVKLVILECHTRLFLSPWNSKFTGMITLNIDSFVIFVTLLLKITSALVIQ